MSDVDSFEDSAPSDVVITARRRLSAGAQAFIRQFQPADDDSGCIATLRRCVSSSVQKPNRPRPGGCCGQAVWRH